MSVPTQLHTAPPAEPQIRPQDRPEISPQDRPAVVPPSHRTGWWSMVRPLVLRLHFYAGVLVAPFILLASVTGLLYTVAPQVEQVAYRDLTHVTPQDSTVPLGDQIAAARVSHPDGKILRVDVPPATDRSTRVVFADETLPADYDMSVFVNPYTGGVEGQVRSSGQWLGLRPWLGQFHADLHLGAFGRHYSELAASWLWVVALGGLLLWVARWRRDRRLRKLVVPDPVATGRARAISWHAVIGVWCLLGVLALSVSGLTWSRFAGANIGEVRTALSWTEPTPATSLRGDGPGEHAHHGSPGAAAPEVVLADGAGIDGVLATAREEGLGDPLYLVPPADSGSAWTASENKRDWPTSYDAISVDAASGEMVDRVDFADWPLMAKLTDWVIGAHMGILFGVANQLALAALAIGLIAMTVLGYRMWWLRRPRGASRLRFGRPVPRGGLRRLPWPALGVLLVLVAVVGWFVPMLVASLVGFLLVDVALAAARSRRQARLSRAA